MESRYYYVLRRIITSADFIMMCVCLLLTFYIVRRLDTIEVWSNHNYILFISGLIWVVSSYINNLYSQRNLHHADRLLQATVFTIGFHAAIFIAFLFLFVPARIPYQFLLTFYALNLSAFLFWRLSMGPIVAIIFRGYDPRKVVAIIGQNKGAIKLGNYFATQKSLNFVGYFGKTDQLKLNANVVEATKMISQLKAAAESGVEEVYISVNPNKMKNLTKLFDEAEQHCIRLKFVPDFSVYQDDLNFNQMGEFTVLSSRNEPLEIVSNRFQKRLLDIAVSLFVIIFIFSWLYPILALIIKIQSPGPVIFAQLRTGKNNKAFWCYKFRSMRLNNESEIRQASLHDERITPIGRFMRKTSLDEFPQFFNVLMGYMSIVGPRPHMTIHTDEYRQIIDKYMLRQLLKPGITGWAQINGYRGETKRVELMKRRIEHDLWYSENWTLWLDVKIMAHTFFNMIEGEVNAY